MTKVYSISEDDVVVTIDDIERLGSSRLEESLRIYYNKGLDQGQTLSENTEGFSRYGSIRLPQTRKKSIETTISQNIWKSQLLQSTGRPNWIARLIECLDLKKKELQHQLWHRPRWNVLLITSPQTVSIRSKYIISIVIRWPLSVDCCGRHFHVLCRKVVAPDILMCKCVSR